MIIQFEVDDTQVESALADGLPFATSKPTLVDPLLLPEDDCDHQEHDQVARRIGAALCSSINPTRARALRIILGTCPDDLQEQQTRDSSLRNAIGAVAKLLKPFSSLKCPLDVICTREKHYNDDDARGRRYSGMIYVQTKVGEKVREILTERGVI